MTSIRHPRQSRFWLVFAVLAIARCCFGQVLDGPDSLREQLDRYTRFYDEERWAEALEILQSVYPSDNPEVLNEFVRLRILMGNYEEAVRLVESNKHAINDAWSFAALGGWCADKSPTKCRSYLTRSLDIDPTHYCTQVAIAFAARQDDLRFAMESLRKLFKRHPRYMGGYAVDLGFQLEKADREFGVEQVTRVCRDRPNLAPLIEGSPRIREWLIQRFGGISIGRRAVWRKDSGTSDTAFPTDISFHIRAFPDADAEVWVAPELDGEMQLSSLVYELLNAENSDDANDLYAKIGSGQIDKEGFVREVCKLEHRALLKCRAFVVVEYFAGGLPDKLRPEVWYLNADIDFDKHFKLLPEYVKDYYAKCYEEVSKRSSTKPEDRKRLPSE